MIALLIVIFQLVLAFSLAYTYNKYCYTYVLRDGKKKCHINNFYKIVISCACVVPLLGVIPIVFLILAIGDADDWDSSWKQNKILYWLFK